MKLATIELIQSIVAHPNADKLDLATVSGYTCIVSRDQYTVGEAVVLIQPDTLLPEARWSELFRARSSRVRAMKLRGEWSFGIIMPFSTFFDGMQPVNALAPGSEVSHMIGVTKYEQPQPQSLDAAGYLPTSMPKTDEERYQNLSDSLPYGQLVDVTLKIDGQSATYFCIRDANIEGGWRTGICSRSLEIKSDSTNNYTINERKYNILENLKSYCMLNNVSLALRGEVYGKGIQAFDSNPHSKLPLNFAAFSVWNHDTLSYEGPDDPHYYMKVATIVGVPTVPVIEQQVVLVPELIEKYARGIDKIDGMRFEGVVIKYGKTSFKVINLSYDERK